LGQGFRLGFLAQTEAETRHADQRGRDYVGLLRGARRCQRAFGQRQGRGEFTGPFERQALFDQDMQVVHLVPTLANGRHLGALTG